jgi:hypothetical protein
MLIAIAIALIVMIIASSSYLAFFKPKVFKEIFLYYHFLNVATFTVLFLWNRAVDTSISTILEYRSGEEEFLKDLLKDIKVSEPYYWLFPLFYFLYLLFLKSRANTHLHNKL